MVFGIEVWAAIGFFFAAYAVVGNDALQTLGTFINSNRNMHWTILFAFAALILVVTFTYGWQVNGGDPSYGRLSKTEKYPPISIEWYHTLPPLVLLIITRLGIPVSTSFMVLTIFATLGGLSSMIEKSLIGYFLAFAVGGGLYLVLSRTLEMWFQKHEPGSVVPMGLIGGIGVAYLILQHFVFGFMDSRQVFLFGCFIIVGVELIALFLAFNVSRRLYWVTAQWVTTAYLWGIWLVQDFANIFVFLPRELTAPQGFLAMAVIVVLLGITFANRGGPVQKILASKSNVTDIRSATVIDLIYASLLYYFKELNAIPMSTTWVFLGLIAGREYAFALTRDGIRFVKTALSTLSDLSKAFIGLVISLNLAVGLPFIARFITEDGVQLSDIFSTSSFAWFVGLANLMLLPVFLFLFQKTKATMIVLVLAFGLALLGFFNANLN
ncbi:MAG: hypothetical protein AAF603_00960 [Pseudomonadota bacterium]